MSGPPSRRAIISLYSASLRTARTFSSYNFRNYFIQRTKDTFRTIQGESDPAKIRTLYTDAVQDLAVLRRATIVNQLFGGQKLAVEIDPKKTEVPLERGEN